MRDAGDLLEWAEVHGNCYGTPREPVERRSRPGRDMLFDIDWQGTRQLIAAMRARHRQRIRAAALRGGIEVAAGAPRARTAPRRIARRLRNAIEEIAHWSEYDYVLVNDDLDRSFAALRQILADGRRKSMRRADMDQFVARLLTELRLIAA